MTEPASRPSLQMIQYPDWLGEDWLIHGFSTRGGGYSTAYGARGDLNLGFTPTDDAAMVRCNRGLMMDVVQAGSSTPGATLVTVSQIHSAAIHKVDASRMTAVPGMTGDGLVTATPGLVLGILTADCVPVLIADKRLRVVGAFHAGWRGTVQRIVEKGVAEMSGSFGSSPVDLEALIGPAIGACCYTVGSEVEERFRTEFPYAAELMSRNAGAGEGTVQMDLREANRRQLTAAGVSAMNIHLAGGCTSCEPQRYFSHRQSGGITGRMMSVIGIR